MSDRNPSPSKDWGNGSRSGESRSLQKEEVEMDEASGEKIGGGKEIILNNNNGKSGTRNSNIPKVVVDSKKIADDKMSFEECIEVLRKK